MSMWPEPILVQSSFAGASMMEAVVKGSDVEHSQDPPNLPTSGEETRPRRFDVKRGVALAAIIAVVVAIVVMIFNQVTMDDVSLLTHSSHPLSGPTATTVADIVAP